ncbi:MAG: hypothetical protein ACOCRN_02150 [Spirochaetia bacterium]
MPSQIAHYLFAVDLARRLGGETSTTLTGALDPFLALGAQGPDIFLHNRKRRPAGLNYGIILHRKNAGLFCASLAHANRRESILSPVGAYTLGCISHVVLDRILHPYINVHAGWVEPKQPHTYGYRVNHPFLERIIDVTLLESRRHMTPEELDFASHIALDERYATPLLAAIRDGIRTATRRGGSDTDMLRRLSNAYKDALDYYRYTNKVDVSRAREALAESEEQLPFWLGIYHPPTLPDDIDFTNTGRKPWRHPCTGETYSSESVDDLYDRALAHAHMLFRATVETWEGARDAFEPSPPSSGSAVETAPGYRTDPRPPEGVSLEKLVGNGDLSDERNEGEPCTRRYFDVLPFERALSHLRAYILEAEL